MTRIRDALRREYEQSSQDNGYLLNEIARRYQDGDGSDVGAVVNMPARIEALTGEAVQRAAQTYLDARNYVKVTLVPEGK